MLVLDDKCIKCNNICNVIHFQRNFGNWTSGNNDIDKLIQDTQQLAHNKVSDVLEWIPYNRLDNIEYIAKGEFGKAYHKANWIDGHIDKWDNKDQNYQRFGQNMIVVLKRLDDPKNVTLEFMNEVFFNEILNF
jgi:hypothetical protein